MRLAGCKPYAPLDQTERHKVGAVLVLEMLPRFLQGQIPKPGRWALQLKPCNAAVMVRLLHAYWQNSQLQNQVPLKGIGLTVLDCVFFD